VEWFASSSSVTSSLSSVAQWGLRVGCGSMDSRRVVAPSGAMVTSIASLERGLASVEHFGDGQADCDVEVTSRALSATRFLCILPGSQRWWWLRNKAWSIHLCIVLDVVL
jgi:hypothetical protein